jgi:hypothetical protein
MEVPMPVEMLPTSGYVFEIDAPGYHKKFATGDLPADYDFIMERELAPASEKRGIEIHRHEVQVGDVVQLRGDEPRRIISRQARHPHTRDHCRDRCARRHLCGGSPAILEGNRGRDCLTGKDSSSKGWASDVTAAYRPAKSTCDVSGCDKPGVDCNGSCRCKEHKDFAKGLSLKVQDPPQYETRLPPYPWPESRLERKEGTMKKSENKPHEHVVGETGYTAPPPPISCDSWPTSYHSFVVGDATDETLLDFNGDGSVDVRIDGEMVPITGIAAELKAVSEKPLVHVATGDLKAAICSARAVCATLQQAGQAMSQAWVPPGSSRDDMLVSEEARRRKRAEKSKGFRSCPRCNVAMAYSGLANQHVCTCGYPEKKLRPQCPRGHGDLIKGYSPGIPDVLNCRVCGNWHRDRAGQLRSV